MSELIALPPSLPIAPLNAFFSPRETARTIHCFVGTCSLPRVRPPVPWTCGRRSCLARAGLRQASLPVPRRVSLSRLLVAGVERPLPPSSKLSTYRSRLVESSVLTFPLDSRPQLRLFQRRPLFCFLQLYRTCYLPPLRLRQQQPFRLAHARR